MAGMVYIGAGRCCFFVCLLLTCHILPPTFLKRNMWFALTMIVIACPASLFWQCCVVTAAEQKV